jgi:hypothetical protein
VTDVNDVNQPSSTLKYCSSQSGVPKSLDITEIVGKQDNVLIKFTVRLAGAPATSSCASYVLHVGSYPLKTYELAYIYRPGTSYCGLLPEKEAFFNQKSMSTQLVTAFNAADPGHVSFTIPKAEFFNLVSTPTYYLKVCTNAKADATKDLTDCSDDTCETPVHR